MKKYLCFASYCIFNFLLVSCSQQVTLNLPVYQPKMVLEFYLEDNKSINCLLQESVNYTDTAITTLINNALVILRYNGVSDTLSNEFYFDRKFEKIYNYHNNKILRLQPNVEYELYIKDAFGRVMTGSTRVNSIVPMDTIVLKKNSKNLASAGLAFQDNGFTKNYYRIVAYKDSAAVNQDKLWDIRFSDILFNGEQFSFYTGYDFDLGDTVIGRLYHLTEEHNNFVESVGNAQSSNGNPFGQPANILSNVTGGIGIFTTLNYDENVMVVR